MVNVGCFLQYNLQTKLGFRTEQMINAEMAMKDLVAKGIKIPPQPKVLLDLNRKLASESFDVHSLAQIVATDPGITAMLFKAARSPMFGCGKKFETLDQVIMVIGVNQTFNLVQAMALRSSVSDKSRKILDFFWTRSHEIAQMAALIAKDRQAICNVFPDQAYMAGIFHGCGVPLLLQRFPDYCKSFQLDKQLSWPNLAEEDARFNVDHCSIGYIVARHWGLPDFVCAAIAYHDEMPSEEVGTVRTLVAILQLSIHFYYLISGVETPGWDKIGKSVLDELGIGRDEEQDYFEEISESFLAIR